MLKLYSKSKNKNKSKTLILISGDKILSLRVNLFFQSLILFLVVSVSIFLTYHITIYLQSQGKIEKKDHTIFINETINKNLSNQLNFLIEEMEEITKAISDLGITKKSNQSRLQISQKISSQIKSEEDLKTANQIIKNTISYLSKEIEDNILTINSTLNKVGIKPILQSKKIIDYKTYKKNNLIDKEINYSISEISSEIFSEIKYKLNYVKTVQNFISSLPIVAPIKGLRITSGYGVRKHPILKKKIMHHGIDFKGSHKSPIQATASARVKFAGWSNSFGNLIILDHGNSITTVYAHLSERKVRTGQRVKKNDIIGLQGSTGRSTGEHLHYEVHYKGKSINPVKFLQINQVSIEN